MTIYKIGTNWYFDHPKGGRVEGPYPNEAKAKTALSAILTVLNHQAQLTEFAEKIHQKRPDSLGRTPIPDFKTSNERNDWIIQHADYFTVIRRQKRMNEREEFLTLEGAEARANTLLQRNPEARYLIYAVYGMSDTWVKTVEAGK